MLNKHSSGKESQFRKKIDNIEKDLKGGFKAEVQAWKIPKSILKDANTSLKSILKVRTISSSRESVNLLDFYYEAKFLYKNRGKQDHKEVLAKDFLNFTQKKSIISGTVGQGKSISLRYLTFLELVEGKSIPIFLELRKLRANKTLLICIKERLKNLGLASSESLIRELLNYGFISLYLDGFDEIRHEDRNYWLDEITSFSESFGEAKIVLTTRPNTEIFDCQYFETYRVQEIGDRDYPHYIKRAVPDEEDQNALIKKLNDADKEILSLLTTPLMMMLFINVYGSRRKLPNNKSEFYDELFSTILSRHDGLKSAYDRPTKSGFTDKDLKKGLEAICYISRKKDLREFSESKLEILSIEAMNRVGLDSSKHKEFVKDICNITCLLLQEGTEYYFIHDSIQEFYSASFIRSQEEIKHQFYEKYLDEWEGWIPELYFLEYIDEYSFNKYFIKASIEKVFEVEDDKIIKIKNDVLNDILKSTSLVFYGDESVNAKLLGMDSQGISPYWAVFRYFSIRIGLETRFYKRLSDFNDEFLKLIHVDKLVESELARELEGSNFKFYFISLFNFYRLVNEYDEVLGKINLDDLNGISSIYDNCISLINKKKNMAGVF